MVKLVEKLLIEADNNGASFVKFIVTDTGVTYTSDSGKRRSTRNYILKNTEILLEERYLKKITNTSLLFTKSLKRLYFTLQDGRSGEFHTASDEDNKLVIVK